MTKTPPKAPGVSRGKSKRKKVTASTAAQKRAGGRPGIFTVALGLEICDLIAQGKSLRTVCAMKKMPALSTVLDWLASKRFPEFSEQYARARETRADVLVEEALAVAKNDRTAQGEVQRDKLYVDTIKWYASKVLPLRYGEKVAHIGGGDGSPPIEHTHRLVALDFDAVQRKRDQL